MRKVKIGVILLITLALAYYGVSRVLAQVELPRVTTACELKSGLLFAIDDDFSILKKCPGRSRRVVLIGEKGDKGDQGDPGEKGEKGDKGDPGEPGTILTQDSFYTTIHAPFTAGSTAHTVLAGCDNGDVAIGGGAEKLSGNINNLRTITSHPYPDSGEDSNAHVWVTTVISQDGSSQTFRLLVRCLDLPPLHEPELEPPPDLTPFEVQFSVVDDISFDKGTAQANKPIRFCTYASSAAGSDIALDGNIIGPTLCMTPELWGASLLWMRVESFDGEVKLYPPE